MSAPIIWALQGPRTGDNNQVLALAETLGLPFRTVQLRYNLARAVTRLLGPSRLTLDRASRANLAPPWPDVVIGIGRRSVPVARWIKRASGGKTRIVLIGNPRIDPSVFDLVITTRQYPVPPGDNVLALPIGLSRYQTPPEPTADEIDWLAPMPRPLRIVAIGGATKYWQLSKPVVDGALAIVRAKPGGSLIVVTSRRTDPGIVAALRRDLAGAPNERLVEGAFPRFAMLLGQAAEIHVTADSISMLSEAILAGKPVGSYRSSRPARVGARLGPNPVTVGRRRGGATCGGSGTICAITR